MRRLTHLLATLIAAQCLPAQVLVPDPTFNTGQGVDHGNGDGVKRLAVYPDGRLLCAGSSEAYNGIPVDRLFRVFPDGSLDNFFPQFPDTMSEELFDVALQPNGHVLVAGNIIVDNYGYWQYGFGRLLPSGDVDPAFLQPYQALRHAIAVSPNGNIFTGGVSPLFRVVDPSGTSVFVENGNIAAKRFCVQPDGRVLAAGDHGVTRHLQNGTLDTTWQMSFQGQWPTVTDLVLHPDGRVLIVGSFTHVNGIPRNGVARLWPDGALDTSFDPGSGFSGGWRFATDTIFGDKYLVSTTSSTYDGTPLPGDLVQLNADGSLDLVYDAGVAYDLLTVPGNKVYLSGNFASLNNVGGGLLRLMPDLGTTVPHTPSTAPLEGHAMPLPHGLQVSWSDDVHGTVDLFDMQGRLLHRQRLDARRSTLPVTPPRGAYLLHYQGDDGRSATVRFVGG